MRKSKGHGLLSFLIVTALAALTFSFLTRSGQKTIDYWQDRYRTHQNWFYYKLGKPLPGTPDLSRLDARLKEKGLKRGAPLFMRVFKLESELELWMAGEDGFKLFATYPICRWSGRLGPKQKEGDRQSPEGVYTVRQRQLNANSRWYRSFNLGYPNIYDKSFKRTGSFLMVHGGCSSIGCYAMTNAVMKEIWDLVTATYRAGHKSFTVHAFPFRMTARNLNVYRQSPWHEFWTELEPAYSLFNQHRIPPEVNVCEKKYQIRPASMVKTIYQQTIGRDCKSLEVSKNPEADETSAPGSPVSENPSK